MYNTFLQFLYNAVLLFGIIIVYSSDDFHNIIIIKNTKYHYTEIANDNMGQYYTETFTSGF